MNIETEKIDLAALRKAHRINQQTLADQLDMRQSFLSAIENGKSRLPKNRLGRLLEIFGEEELARYSCSTAAPYSNHSPEEKLSEPDMMAKILRIFHSHEHESDTHNHELHHKKIDELQERIGRLLDRNESLSEKAMTLQERLDLMTAKNIEAQNEIYRLREILIRHNISF